ncbi:MAG: hypothetical protein H6838_16045 [Planctomycetes bacterium]|nr:hypothetical protein [Planctomycetota bacterium]MCB9887004.1 hypothetical protein [Planctomycetota bacterium]
MTDVLEDDRLRYLDVLLEEEFAVSGGGIEAAPSPRSRRWLAAALVWIACGAVLGTVWLQRELLVTAQDPHTPQQATSQFVPKDQDGLEAFLARVRRVGVERIRNMARPREDGPDFEVIADEVRADLDEATRALTRGWRQVSGEDTGDAGTVRLWTDDGRELAARYSAAGRLWVGGQAWQLPDDGVRELARLAASKDAVDTWVCVYRPAGLLRVPDTLRGLACPGGAAEQLQDVLPRLRGLQSLSLSSTIDDRGAVLVGRLPSLRELTLVHPDLGPAGWAALAKAQRLRSLEVRGPVPGLVPEVLPELVSHLEQLRICGTHDGSGLGIARADAEFPVSPEQLQGIVTSPTLVDLRVAVTWHPLAGRQRQAEQLLDDLLAMPKLRRLAFASRNGDPQALWSRLAKSSLEKLKLAGVGLDEAEIGVLASMAGLRELDLRGCGFTARARRATGDLSQLTRLDVSGCAFPGPVLDGLRERLADTVVLGKADTTSRSYPLLGAPSWTRD